jgi:hypothetical protein
MKDNQWEQWEELGRRWLNNEVTIAKWQGMTLNPKQVAFLNDKSRFPLFYGGMGAGKTMPAILKLILLSLFFPGNNLLLARKSRTQVEKTVLRDFFDLAPEGSYEYKVGPGQIKFHNGSEIQIFGLEASASGSELEGAVAAIKGMNLGGGLMDQMEDLEKEVFEAIQARMRRKVPFLQFMGTINPVNHWSRDYYLVNPRPETALYQTSMLDNKANLPPGYIEIELAKSKSHVNRNVYGSWDIEDMPGNAVFDREYIDEQALFVKEPIRTFHDTKIFEEPNEKHLYQIGVDTSDASVDPCGMVVVNKNTGEVAATYSQWVTVEKQVEVAVWLGYRYNQALLVPESAPSASGAAFTQDIKKKYNNIYVRKTRTKFDDKETGKLGFQTNYGSKTELIEHKKELLGKHFPKWRDKQIVEEARTFIYSQEAKQKGAGAQAGFHDDLLFATLLAYHDMKPIAQEELARQKSQWDKVKLYNTTYD